MTAPDPGHLLPDADWAAVVAAAAVEAERISSGLRPMEAPLQVPGQYGTGALVVSGQVVAPRNGGRRPRGAPTFGVLHSAETPLAAGYAASIARYFRDKAPTSCHYMTDPAETWGVLPDELVAWHCGNGNPNSLALEQAGYARFSRAEWLTPAGHAQMARNGAVMRAARDRYGIGLYWMTDQQLRDAHAGRIVGGWATHDQCRRVLGGTTHSDPMPNFPLTEQMAIANGSTTEDNDMDARQDQLLTQVHQVLFSGSAENPQKLTTHWRLVDVQMALTNALPVLLKAATQQPVNVQELAGAVVAGVLPAIVAEVAQLDPAAGVDSAAVESIVEQVLRRVLGGLDAPTGAITAAAPLALESTRLPELPAAGQ